MERMRLNIQGMSCNHCVTAVTDALRKVPGVTVDQVTIGEAAVEFDPQRTTEQSIVDAVNDEGYEAVRA